MVGASDCAKHALQIAPWRNAFESCVTSKVTQTDMRGFIQTIPCILQVSSINVFLFSEIFIKLFTHEPHFGGVFVVYKLSLKMGTFLLLMIKNSLFKDKKKYIMILIFILTLV